jgi:hypothetical protein
MLIPQSCSHIFTNCVTKSYFISNSKFMMLLPNLIVIHSRQMSNLFNNF